MVVIELETLIDAPVERVFDLSLSVDAHVASAGRTKERAIAGVTSGVLGLDQKVTWEAVHFGVKQRLEVMITEWERPVRFVDEMVRGAFKSMRHEHRFVASGSGTLMYDTFVFEAPFGFLGRIVEWLVLEGYMRGFLYKRNQVLKELAESDDWRLFLASNEEEV